MNAAEWERLRTVFDRATDLPPEHRRAWLDAEVGTGTDLRLAIDRLLKAEADSGDFLVPPGSATLGAVARTTPDAAIGMCLGPFRLIRTIGSGGMGTVFAAEQDHPQRTVALKTLRLGLAAPRARERFRDEIDALARMQHPGIAQVFQADVDADGTPWFAMELLDGAVPVTTYAERSKLGYLGRVRLFEQVVAAIQHAHQRGVIHRDLKPANVLAMPDGRVKIIDFGIARLQSAEGVARTQDGSLLGTLAYMSPEQVDGADTDVRTDVYGLGALLYELLAGRPPFELAGVALTEACRNVLEIDPAAPSTFADVPRELDWIVAHAMAKEPSRRYATAADLGADIARFLADEPIAVAPPGAAYHARKFVRRHRTAVAVALFVMLATIGTLTAIVLALLRAQAAEQTARDERSVARAQERRASLALDFLLDVFASVDPRKDGREVKMADALARAARDFDTRFADEPEIHAAFARTIGQAYLGLGLYDDAERHLKTALAVREARLPDDRVALVNALLDLANLEIERGRSADAESVLSRANSMIEDTPDSKLEAVAAVHRANLLRSSGDKAGAARLLEDAIPRLRRERGDGDRETLLAVNLLAGVLHGLGQLEAAEPLYHEAVDGLLALKGEDHPDTLVARNNLAVLLHMRGRRAETIAMLEQVLATRRRVLGDAHPDTIGTLSNLAGLYFLEHRLDDSAAAYDEGMHLLAEHVSKDLPVYRTVLVNYATVERDRGAFAHAVELLEEALASTASAAGAPATAVLAIRNLLADVQMVQGHDAEALTLYRECLAMAEAQLAEDHPTRYACTLGVGRCALRTGAFDDAETALLWCLQHYDAALAKSAVKSQLSRPEPDLLELYTAWKRTEDAAHYRAIVEAPGYQRRASSDR